MALFTPTYIVNSAQDTTWRKIICEEEENGWLY